MTRRARGFTLIEVVVGLAVAALVMLVARGVSGALADASRSITDAARAADARAISGEMLRTALAGAAIDGDSARFTGTTQFASFRSHCPVGGGWRESCPVLLAVIHGDSLVVALRLGTAQPINIGRARQRAELTFLESAARGGEWQRTWSDPHSFPLAIGVVLDADTAVVPVGAHR